MTDLRPPDAAPNNGWHAAFVDALPDAVLVFRTDSGRIVTANPAAARMFGYDPRALPGMHFSGLLPPLTSNPNTSIARRFPLGGHLAEAEIFCNADGDELLCDTLVVPMRAGADELVALHLRDVRTREDSRAARSEEQHAAAEAAYDDGVARALDRYMSHVSHELKTPLAVILSSSSMLERYYLRLSDAKREEHFARIQAQVRYLTEYLDNLRFLNHLDSGQVQVRRDDCDAAELLQEIVGAYAGHPQGPLFDVQTGGSVSRLSIDGGLWRRIVSHLVSNAVKYGPRGGTVRVSVTNRDDGLLETRVTDRGSGLPAEFRTVAFEAFRRGPNSAETQGGGLGLAIAGRCAALHGGSLAFEAAPDIGTTFTLLLPLDG
jgi:PAS domain S-box-containing protein